LLSATVNNLSKSIAFVFLAAIVLQSFHMLEHVVQIHQHAILGWSIQDSSGLFAVLNLEEIHWFYNAGYLILLAIVFKKCSFLKIYNRPNPHKVFVLLFNLSFFLQGYHVVEHSVRMVQYLQTQCVPCPGILGPFVDGVYLHFTLNFLVFIYPLAAFFVLGFHKKIISKILKQQSTV
jgi:hypothetical protein